MAAQVRSGSKRTLLQIAGFLFILISWSVFAAYNRRIMEKPFPYPWESAAVLFRPGPKQSSAFLHTGASLLRWGAGYAIAVVTGIITGIVTGLIRPVKEILNPGFTVLQVIPGLAWIPVVLLLFGLGNKATIFMIAITAVVPIIINTQGGISQIDPQLMQAAAMMELKPIKKFGKVVLPGAAPSIISGLRVGAANGFRVLISAEMIVGTGLGLGYSLFQSRWALDYESAFGALIIIAFIGLILEKGLFIPLERKVNRKRGLER